MAKKKTSGGAPGKPADAPAPETDQQARGEAAPEKPERPPETENVAPGEIRLKLTADAVLGNGRRKAGELLGSCHVHPDATEAEVMAAVRDPRWTEEVPHESNEGTVIRMARDRGERQKGDELCLIVPAETDAEGRPADYTVRECVNALRNPSLLGR